MTEGLKYMRVCVCVCACVSTCACAWYEERRDIYKSTSHVCK